MTPAFGKSWAVLALLGISAAPLAMAASKADRSAASAANPRAPTPALDGLDPVLLTQGRRVRGRAELSRQRGRFRYVFATDANRRRFARDPQRYEIQNNGQCAMMPVARGNPALFTVRQGRIYVFGSEMCHSAWVADPGKYLNPRKNVAILLWDGVELLDFAGPGEVFTAAAEGRAFNVYTVAARPEPLVSQGFVTVQPQYTFANCPRPDILVVPGGAVETPTQDPGTMQWIKSTSKRAGVTFSVCTGALLLARAGLLDGREATTHSNSLEVLRKQAPRTKVRSGVRYVDTGTVLTSAGVSAGTDAALHLVERLLGADAAVAAAKRMEYPWRP